MQGAEKAYDPDDTTLKFVNRPDDLDPLPPEDGDISLRAEMSCGHAVTPESLTGWCRSVVDQGQYKFLCPALKNDTLQKCNALWPYQEVRRLAVLTAEEMRHFEEKIAHMAAAEYCEFKDCPGCKTLLEREDLANLSVQCTVCTADKRRSYEFCWQCLKPWNGPGPRSDRCDNDGCVNHDLETLKNAMIISFLDVGGVKCPSLRACPTCGQRQEHKGTGCKNVICHRCQVEFCFVCLKLIGMCSKIDASYFSACSAGVAPVQTSIPVWHRK